MRTIIDSADGGRPIYAWIDGVSVEDAALKQLANVARMPFVHHHVAVMPDVHFGKGATVGTVLATDRAVIPAAVGVDKGCGMAALQTSLRFRDLPTDLPGIRAAIERNVPAGRTNNGGEGDRGAWHNVPDRVAARWAGELADDYRSIVAAAPGVEHWRVENQLGTLGGGNHFLEICRELRDASPADDDPIWIMLHSGSRGAGNKIGMYYIQVAQELMQKQGVELPDRDLAYFTEDMAEFHAYMEAVDWAQRYARANRDAMLLGTVQALRVIPGMPDFLTGLEEPSYLPYIDCHHNYVTKEYHYDKSVWVTRKGAVSARAGERCIIPGSMGARSYICRGLGNVQSFESCSHGAGRAMSRTEAKRRFTLEDHRAAVDGVECAKGADSIDETPAAYKSIDAVMAAQTDLVEPLHALKQIICVKGVEDSNGKRRRR